MNRERPLRASMVDAFEHDDLAPSFERVEKRLRRRRLARRASAGLAMIAVIAMTATIWPIAEGPPAAPLSRSDGTPLRDFVAGVNILSDHSEVTLIDGVLTVDENNERELRLDLVEGRARFDVRSRGARRWTIRAGAVTVVVLGTSFTIVRRDPIVSVDVHHGVVAVDAGAETRRLYAGERFEVGPPHRTEAALADAHAQVPRTMDEQDRAPAAARVEVSSRRAIPPARARAAMVESVTVLLERADTARRESDTAAAILALRAIVEDHPSSSEAPSAAVTLGQLELARGETTAAIEAYRSALARTPSPAIAELCYERLVRAHLAEQDRPSAEAVAAEYRARFPDGARTESIEALLDPP